MKKEKHYRDNYKIVIEFPEEKFPIASDSVLSENFSPRSKEELDRLIKDKFKKYFATSNEKIEYSEIKISAEINRFTNEIQNLSLSKKMNVSSDIAFAGELEYLGKTSCSFVAEENLKYEFTFPKVVLSKNELSIKTKTDDSLEAALTAPQGIKAKWSTSDDSIVSVDEDGYIKTHKIEGSAIVTVSFEFNGKTYSDTCKINVGTAVDGMKISEKKLKMDVGETEKLTANVEPKNATIKEITWISMNEKVAKVDNEGNVTATGKGSTIVYAVSVDGNYKASCEITVS